MPSFARRATQNHSPPWVAHVETKKALSLPQGRPPPWPPPPPPRQNHPPSKSQHQQPAHDRHAHSPNNHPHHFHADTKPRRAVVPVEALHAARRCRHAAAARGARRGQVIALRILGAARVGGAADALAGRVGLRAGVDAVGRGLGAFVVRNCEGVLRGVGGDGRVKACAVVGKCGLNSFCMSVDVYGGGGAS